MLEIERCTKRMIRKKRVRNPLTSNGQTKYLYNITTTTMVLILYLLTGISCCVVTPREILATVGEVVSFGCNAKTNNEAKGTLTNLKIENENKPDTLIFRNPVYGENREILIEQFVAPGYFLLSKSGLVDATIQVNETQLRHGGRYVCSCSTAEGQSTGSGNLVVLDKLSFVLNGENSQTSLLDLNCSFSFSGSISSAVSVDLTIHDANGTELAAKRNLSLSWRSQGGSHHVNYSFIAQRNTKEQNFTCEMKAWNHSSSEKQLLRSTTANYSLQYSDVTPETVSKVTAAVVTVSVLVVMVLLVLLGIYMIRRKRRTCKSNISSFVAHKSSTPTQRVRYEGVKSSIEHPTEDKKQKNKTGADDELFVVENEIYDASSGCIIPIDDHKAEQIYNEIC